MKKQTLILLTIVLTCVASRHTARAADGPVHFPPPQSPEGEPNDFRNQDPPRGHMRRGVEMFMIRLSQDEPEEFERLKKLRKENPSAFRSELRERLEQKRQAAFGRGSEGGPPSDAPGASRPEPSLDRDGTMRQQPLRNNDNYRHMQELRSGVRDLARQYQKATGDQREQIADKIRSVLGEIFDSRREMRLQSISHLEKKVDEMKRLITEQSEKRDDIIERDFESLLQKNPPRAERRGGKEKNRGD